VIRFNLHVDKQAKDTYNYSNVWLFVQLLFQKVSKFRIHSLLIHLDLRRFSIKFVKRKRYASNLPKSRKVIMN